MKKVTIVTAYYKMVSKQSHETYVEWMSIMLCTIQTPMVIFTDEESRILIEQFRQSLPTKIIIRPREQWYVSQKYSHEQWEKHHLMDHETNHSIDLYKVWNEKASFLREAIILNPFHSEYFMWCDIGCFRESKKSRLFKEWPSFEKVKHYSQNKLLLLLVKDIPKELKAIDDHGLTPSFQKEISVGGTMFCGNREACLKWIYAFYETLDLYFKYDLFAGKDQNIMATTLVKYPELVNVILKPDQWFYFHEFLL